VRYLWVISAYYAVLSLLNGVTSVLHLFKETTLWSAFRLDSEVVNHAIAEIAA